MCFVPYAELLHAKTFWTKLIKVRFGLLDQHKPGYNSPDKFSADSNTKLNRNTRVLGGWHGPFITSRTSLKKKKANIAVL